MKSSNSAKTSSKPRASLKVLAAKAAQAQEQADAARKRARLAKARFKAARKAFKHAKKLAKQARKEAKTAVKVRSARAKARKKSVKPRKPAKNSAVQARAATPKPPGDIAAAQTSVRSSTSTLTLHKPTT